MAMSLYQASISPCLQMLDALSAVLGKAASYAAERGIEPSVLLQSRLYPDMLPLIRQVQIATDSAKAGGARLAGVDTPSFPDTEASFDELQARLARCVSFLRSLDRNAIDAAAERRIEFSVAKKAMVMVAPEYVGGWMLPNFFFHVTTAYDILRHNGLAVGKRDFLGAIPLAS
jgi:uncharacterized protein